MKYMIDQSSDTYVELNLCYRNRVRYQTKVMIIVGLFLFSVHWIHLVSTIVSDNRTQLKACNYRLCVCRQRVFVEHVR
jgi:hypothetical protein